VRWFELPLEFFTRLQRRFAVPCLCLLADARACAAALSACLSRSVCLMALLARACHLRIRTLECQHLLP